MSSLFEPWTSRSLTVPNRIWMAPMCQYSADTSGPDVGAPNDWHFTHYTSRAVGGAGLVLSEATAVSPEGRISPADAGLWNDRQQEAWTRVVAAVRAHGAVAGIQLAHAGRKASTHRPWEGGGPLGEDEAPWTTLGPSPVPFTDGYPVPHELTEAEIGEVVEQFVASARRALAAGFQVAEVHGAHGYLIGEFLSPHSNRRTDRYGGDFAGRTRLALEVVEAVRAVWPDELPLFFRVSATDWLPEGGWTPDDTVRLAGALRARGVDLLDVSSGGNAAGVTVPTEPGYQVPFAARVRRETELPVAAVGLITEPAQAAKILEAGEADAVFLGRVLLREPYWPQRAARELGVAGAPVPLPYERAH
ncbi:NADH:flavin oxidoreductase/NADH oxidase [Streptomyces sp. 3MP-14]|uniref:NADH:flavin oxidoreductase/NADH oxidase n=1 Tax=Streptomyces mimosae TaxID=2586635 RepID=A0A5N5ZUS2_9ACTN|nr:MULTISPECIES: NADH:flavin oxidoreductase/NADH oxidase [Streptomyces]KAB8160261.1 NADH:flavin oxidoreductase/NADH oxidase [Streptomyces mimosae]KAB8172977.1 NADH:flavin oxidoreductase/NADH oxidase [Streptomyces sp. 3MP-14]